MPFVRTSRTRVLIAHSERTEDGRVVQAILHRFNSPAELERVLEPAGWREWTRTMAWTYPSYRWSFDSIRARLEQELARWLDNPSGAAERRKKRIVRLVDELGGALGGLSPCSETDADLIEAVEPGLRAIAEQVTRLIEPWRSPPISEEQTMILNPPIEADEAEDLFDQGMEHWWRGDRTSACRLYRAALRRRPDHVDAKVHLGLRALDRGRVADAARLFESAIDGGADSLIHEDGQIRWIHLENRPYLRALGNLGLARSRQRRHAEALTIYKRMLWLNPNDNQGIQYRIGDVYHRLGRLDEAIAAYSEGQEEPGCAYGLALALHQLGRREDWGPAILGALAVNRYFAPMLLGLPWKRVDGFHGCSWSEPDAAADLMQHSADLWRKDRTAGVSLRRLWTSAPVQEWITELNTCTEGLGIDDVERRREWLARDDHARSNERRLEVLAAAAALG